MLSKLLLLTVIAFSFANAYITNIAVDVQRGQIYVTENNILYELDNSAVVQNGVHYTPGVAETNILNVGKRGNRAALFGYLETDTTQKLVAFNLPLGSATTLSTVATVSLPPGLSNPSVYDNVDRIAVLSVSRNLTLVNLNNFAVLDTFRYYQNRVFGINLVYNRANKHLILFYTRVPVNGDYGLSVDEWDLSTGKFVEVATTYNCLCGDGYNDTASPFYKVVLDEGQCKIDYSTSPSRIWCSWSEGNKYFSFNAANLSDYRIHSTGPQFNSIAWDFENRYAFTIRAATTTGFTVNKVRLESGAYVSSYNNDVHNIDTSVFTKDTNEPHLYLAVYDETDRAKPKIVSVNTNNMATAKIVTLTTAGL